MSPVSFRAAWRTAVFTLKLMPMLPSRAVDWLTPAPRIERVCYPAPEGEVDGNLYRPGGRGPHPGVVISLGVVPFGVDHPQVPRLGEALARAGLAALMVWSPAMRALRLDPCDRERLARAYAWLIDQPGIDPRRSGFIGTCVGGAFALMAAAHPAIRDRVAFVAAFAPYASMHTLARDIASRSRETDHGRGPWAVDPLTRKVFEHTLLADLAPEEAALVQAACAAPDRHGPRGLSSQAEAIYRLLRADDVESATRALSQLPGPLRQRFDSLSPCQALPQLQTPLIVWCHDQDDQVIPVDESRRLRAALAGRPDTHYTEFSLFEHADPTRRRHTPRQLIRELGKFFGYVYPIFSI
jgi:dienelactone hydrolase